MSLFEGRDLVCIRGERCVFAGLSFAVPAGGALILTGANGSGKSSLLRLMAGLLAPAAGSLTWDGAPIAEDSEAHRARLRYVGHLNGIKPVLSVAENVTFQARLAGGTRGAVEAALAAFGLTPLADVAGHLLSAGQRRRVALARLLAAPGDLWLLDEPAAGLDRAAEAALTAAIAAHRAAGGRVVAATHTPLDLPDARTLDVAAFTGPAPAVAAAAG